MARAAQCLKILRPPFSAKRFLVVLVVYLKPWHVYPGPGTTMLTPVPGTPYSLLPYPAPGIRS